MIQTIAILGGHIQALGLARQAKACGLRTIIITDDRCSVARWSRCVDEVRFYSDQSELLSVIKSLFLPLSSSLLPSTMLFPTSDDYIDLMVDHYDEWKDRLYLAIPSPETVALFANKRTTYQFCEQSGIAHPHSFYPENMDDVRAIAPKLDYPCVVKPAVMYSFHKLLGKKAFLIQNEIELIEQVKRIEQVGFPINLMVVQEFMAGGAKNLYSFGTFAVDGESLADIQVNRIRQNPMTFGNSTTYCHMVHIPEIETVAKEILRKTHYTGMGEVEFMYDKGKYKFLEINTRAWKWHTITNQLGFSFIGEWIKWINDEGRGKREEVRTRNDERLTMNKAVWVERLTDCVVSIREILHGRMKLMAWLRTLCRKKESAVWSWRDPLPAIMYVLLSPVLYIKRY